MVLRFFDSQRMLETHKKLLHSDAIPSVLEHHGLTGRIPLQGLKYFISDGVLKGNSNGFDTG
jgi:hypothetical protein